MFECLWVFESSLNYASDVRKNYRGFTIFKYEHKFFVVDALEIGKSNEKNKQGVFGNGQRQFVAIEHSLTEACLAVDRIIDSTSKISCSERHLVFACISDAILKPLLQKDYNMADLTIFVGPKQRHVWQGYNVIECNETSLKAWLEKHSNGKEPYSENLIKPDMFDIIVVPWLYPDSWHGNALEVVAQKLSSQVEVLHANGGKRLYSGESLHRLVYNKAYLASMFQVIPQPVGKKVLEVGCSDGLVCDIFSLSGAEKVTGIDVMKTTGCRFPGKNIEYQAMDAAQLSFEDKIF